MTSFPRITCDRHLPQRRHLSGDNEAADSDQSELDHVPDAKLDFPRSSGRLVSAPTSAQWIELRYRVRERMRIDSLLYDRYT